LISHLGDRSELFVDEGCVRVEEGKKRKRECRKWAVLPARENMFTLARAGSKTGIKKKKNFL